MITGDATRIRFGSYNMEDFGLNPKTEEVLKAQASTIKTLDADVLAVQEVKSKEDLDQFTATYLDNDYPYKAVFPAPGCNQNVGVMSRFPITETASHLDHQVTLPSGETKPFLRDVGEAHIDIPGYPTTVFVDHLKADPYYKNNPTPQKMAQAQERRAAEVDGVLEIVKEAMPGIPSQHYIVCGDMNAAPESPEMVTLRSSKDVPMTDLLGSLQGDAGISHPATHKRMDYLLTSPTITDDVVPGSARILDTPEARKSSDHLPTSFDVIIPSAQ